MTRLNDSCIMQHFLFLETSSVIASLNKLTKVQPSSRSAYSSILLKREVTTLQLAMSLILSIFTLQIFKVYGKRKI